MCKYQEKAVVSIKTKNSKCQLTIDPYENKWKHGSKIGDMDGACSSQQANSTNEELNQLLGHEKLAGVFCIVLKGVIVVVIVW